MTRGDEGFPAGPGPAGILVAAAVCAGVEVLPQDEAVAYERDTWERRWNRRTSLVVDPPDGRIPPMTEAAQALGTAAVA